MIDAQHENFIFTYATPKSPPTETLQQFSNQESVSDRVFAFDQSTIATLIG